VNDIVIRAVRQFLSGAARQEQMKPVLEGVHADYEVTLEKLMHR
jgi:hypothetical protein